MADAIRNTGDMTSTYYDVIYKGRRYMCKVNDSSNRYLIDIEIVLDLTNEERSEITEIILSEYNTTKKNG
jgi:hypothetical protein